MDLVRIFIFLISWQVWRKSSSLQAWDVSSVVPAVRVLDFLATALPSPACTFSLIVKTTRLCFLNEERKGTMSKQKLLFQFFILRSFLRNCRQQLLLSSHCSEIRDVGHNTAFCLHALLLLQSQDTCK